MYLLPDLVFLDIEITGGSHLYNHISEVALIKIEQAKVSSVWKSQINPCSPILHNFTGLTGNKDNMVKDALKSKP